MGQAPTIVVNRNTPAVVETFSRLGKVIALDTQEVTRESVRNADVLVVRSETRVDRGLLEGSRVRFVGTVTIGTDHVDLEYLAANGIGFASAPGSNANSVAEYIAAALLVWSERTGEALNGKTIGVVGVGNVGSRVVSVARALGMNVILNDPPLARKTGDPAFLPLDELMGADVLTLHVPLARSGPDATYHLFDESHLSRMKRGSVLINTARGAVVETNALRAMLASKQLSTAILDVWEDEPGIDLALLNNVMLGTAHIAGYSLDGKLNALRMVYGELCRYLGVSVEPDVPSSAHPEIGPRIVVPASIAEEKEVVSFVVRQAYDIELDDYMLRKVIAVAEGERGPYFAKLRAEYRARREFFNRCVELSARQVGSRAILEKLGFEIAVRRDAR
ncbi:MAG TPA: 4-phosphoerythronate dehydrogenase [Bacteroidota bacterium]|nr:4-phosphoerythronate dehydrogenase [Bacteroidota bacterium]